jgi:peptide/nickel transport system substrate-binding protein
MYEGLVALKPGTVKIIPKLATKWKSTNRGKTWTFWLRRGVKFHDGTPFNSAAVCANFNRWYNWTGPFQDPSATFYSGDLRRLQAQRGLRPPAGALQSYSAGMYRAVIVAKRPGRSSVARHRPFSMVSPAAMKKYGADQSALNDFQPQAVCSSIRPARGRSFVVDDWPEGRDRPERQVLGQEGEAEPGDHPADLRPDCTPPGAQNHDAAYDLAAAGHSDPGATRASGSSSGRRSTSRT